MCGYECPVGSLRFRDAAGADTTEAVLAGLATKCPEVLAMTVAAEVFPQGPGGGAQGMADRYGVPFLGRVPLEPSITRACEAGIAGGRTALQHIVAKLRASEPAN